MSAPPLPIDLADRYLELLGVEARNPDDGLLEEIATRHGQRVPFENLTKLRLHAERSRGPARRPDDERFVRQRQELGAGDTCFGIAHALGGLLARLGYRADWVGARVEGGRSVEDGHVACVVTWRDHPLLVDCGFGAPFFEPLPLERAVAARETVVPYARHRLVPAPADRFRMERWDAGTQAWVVLYHLHARPRPFDHFHERIDESFEPAPDRTFLRGLHAVRNEAERQTALRTDRVFTTTAAGVEERRLAGFPEAVTVAEESLGIARDHTEAAVRALRDGLGVDPFDPERRGGA